MITRRGLLKVSTVGAGTIFLGGLAGVAAAAGTFQVRHSQRFFPGVSVGRVALSGLDWDAAVAALESRWGPFLENPLIVKAGEHEWRPSGEEIGVHVDFMTPLREAYSWGRDGGLTARTIDQIATARAPRDWPVVTSFDRSKYAEFVRAVLTAIIRAPVQASLAIEGSGSRRRFVVDPSIEGLSLVRTDELKSFEPDFKGRRAQLIELEPSQVPPTLKTQAMLDTVAKAESMTSGRISVYGKGRSWMVDRDAFKSRLKLQATADGPVPVIDVRNSDFAPLIRQIASDLNRGPVEPKIKFNAESNKFDFLSAPVTGETVDGPELRRRILSALRDTKPSVSIPIKTVEPSLVSATPASLGLNWTFGIGESNFQGSTENRIHNIDVGSGKLDGEVIEPGQTFDFNESLGSIDYETGFVDGLIIINNRTIPGIGGGICQVSTTMFRAAFLSGLPVTERWQHVYRVSYYELGRGNPPGFDASIYQPVLNLKFVNDTNNFLMIRTDFDRDKARLRFRIMGRGPRRLVKVSSWRGVAVRPPPPRIVANAELGPGEKIQTDYSVWGMNAGIGREVWADQKLLFEDRFDSSFRAWSARWEVGPDSKGNLDTTGIEGAGEPAAAEE